MSGSSAGGHIIQVSSTTGDVLILLDRADYRLEFLTPGSDEQRCVPRSQRHPSYLLDPQREVVPYRARVAAQRQLEVWRDDAEEPVSVLMVSGAGGQGKTRLANHVASASHQAGWAVAQGVERTPRLQTGGPRRAVLDEGQPLLVVVDYAERWRLEVLAQLVHDLPLDYPDQRVRVLLLARPGPALWQAMVAQLDRGGVDLAEPVKLGEFVHDEAGRAAAFTEAVHAFARQMDTPVPRGLRLPACLSAVEYRSPLTLHMSALAAVCAADEDQPVPKVQDLSGFLLSHERRYWTAMGNAGCGLLPEVIEQVVFLATMFGPVAGLSAGRALLRRARLADGEADANRLLMTYERLYPSSRTPLSDTTVGELADAGTLLPLRPDRLGEDFVGQYLTQQPHAAPLLAELLAMERDVLSLRRCLIVLAAASRRHPAAANTLFALLRRNPDLAAHVTSGVLQLVVDHAPDDIAAAVEEALPRFNTELLRPAYSLAQRLHSNLPSDAPPALVAHRLNNLGIRLSEVGDKHGALAATRDAVDIRRQLADAEPAAHLPALATALNNLGVHLSEVGDKHGALAATREAVDTYRWLADAEPAANLPELASSLNNLGIQLAEIGDKRGALAAAEETVDIRQRLANAEPGAHLPALATALNNLGICLSRVGDKREALGSTREAVDIRRRLADAEPAAYLPELASSLNNLSIWLSEVGNKREALGPIREAVDIRRRLADAEPAANLPELASSLNNLGVQLAGVGDTRDALAVTREAVDTFRSLAEAEPAAYLPDLAMSLINLGARLSAVGDKGGALAVTGEAVDTYRSLADAEPVAHLPNLATALINLGVYLSEVGDKGGALAATRKTVDTLRSLAGAEPAAYLPNLATSLWAIACVGADGDDDLADALAAVDEAIVIFQTLAVQLPDVFVGHLRAASASRAVVLDGLGRHEEADRLRRALAKVSVPKAH
ncbi:MAG: tetratricopeptide repeat protein [Pseudonocardiaceae bacterium]